MARYKKYRYGGKKIPGMFKKQEGGTAFSSDMPDMQSADEKRMMKSKGSGMAGMNKSGEMERSMGTRGMGRGMGRAMGGRGMGIVQNLAMSNAIKNNQAKQAARVNMQMQEAVMEIKLQNQALEQQNNLLKTQIQKMDLINSARTTKQSPGMKTTPKKRGGSVKAKKGKGKKMIMFAQSSGGTMKHGGSCGGPLMSMMKKSKRR